MKRKSETQNVPDDSGKSSMACDSCRAKKYKCSRDRPICVSCRQHDRDCHYSAQVVRSPLTRVHLDYVENRLQRMAEVFARLLPDLKLEDALSSLSPAANTSQRFEDATGNTKREDLADDTINALPKDADGFDWEEKVDGPVESDGMAALPVEPTGVGYLGHTSGGAFLRSLRVAAHESRNQSPWASDATTESPVVWTSELNAYVQSRETISHLINSYFANYHVHYPFVHEATFRAQYSELVKRPEKRTWNMLLNSILTLGASTAKDEKDGTDHHFYRKAVSSWQDQSMLESGSLALVQALLLLSNYTQKRNLPNTGWNFLGLAVRMALSLGLNREMPKWNISLLQREMRRRVWWGLFIFDSGASLTFGRPSLLPERDMMDVQLPLNIPDELLTPSTETSPTNVSEPTIYSSLIAQVEFFLVGNKITKRLLSTHRLAAKEACELHSSLKAMGAKLPQYFQRDRSEVCRWDWYHFARDRIWWKLDNLVITLTRPFLLEWASRSTKDGRIAETSIEEGVCRKHCIQSARSTIDAIAAYMNRTALSKVACWYALYFLFHAAVIPAICLRVDSNCGEAESWQQDLEKAKDCLTAQFFDPNLARRCLQTLEELRPSRPSRRTEPQILFSEKIEDMPDLDFWAMDAPDIFFDVSGWTDIGQDLLSY